MNTREYWEAKAKKEVLHSATKDLFESYWIKRHFKNFKYLNEGERILDIGCGKAKHFIKLIGKFNKFYGIELSKIHFESAKKVFPAANYIVANGNELPFKDSSFDVIISLGAFEHNEDISPILKECYRVLDKNGALFFSVPNYVSPYFPYVYVYHCIIKKHDRIAAIGRYYTNKQLIFKLQEQGFKKVKVVDTIYSAPISIIDLTEVIRKASMIIYGKSRNEEKMMEMKASDKYGKLKENLIHLSNLFDELFYPLERLGFGFMKIIYCEK